MSKYLLLAVFLALWLESVLGASLSIIPGLSAKNAVVYGAVVWLTVRAVLDGTGGGVLGRKHDLPSLHIAFVFLVVTAAVSVVIVLVFQLYPTYTPLYGVMLWKAYALDHYLVLVVFLVGARNGDDAFWLAKKMMALMGVGVAIGLMDLFLGLGLGVLTERWNVRPEGPLGDANQIGSIMAFLAPSMLALAFANRRGARWMWLMLAALCAVLMLVTASRGAIVALVGGAVIGGLLLRGELSARVVLQASVVMAFAVVVSVLLVPEQFSEVLVGRLTEVGTQGTVYNESSGRTGIWANALRSMAATPLTLLTGFGWKTFNLTNPISSHNDYLDYFYGLGLVGLSLLSYILWLVALTIRRAVRVSEGERRSLLAGYLIGYCGFLVALFLVNMHAPWLFVWAFSGVMLKVASDIDRDGVAVSARSGELGHRRHDDAQL